MSRIALGGLTKEKLQELGGRYHMNLDGRYITILLHRNVLYALDSPCYHAGGPLGEGPVVDIEDIPCIRCPWHNFLVSLDRGEEVTRTTKPPNFDQQNVFRPPTYPMEPPSEDSFEGPAVRGKQVQRVHRVEVEADTGDIVVFLPEDSQLKQAPLQSDSNAKHPQRGAMCIQIRDIKQRGLE